MHRWQRSPTRLTTGTRRQAARRTSKPCGCRACRADLQSQVRQPGMLPQRLSLGVSFAQVVQGVSMPVSLQNLTFDASDQSFQELSLPKDLKSTALRDHFNRSLRA
ncbi:unnamed protein product [Effrenium voratum]|nr:unnamed protein product [Effrenium voratum]